MDDYSRDIIPAMEDFLDVMDKEVLDAFTKNLTLEPHSKEYYETLREVRKLLGEYRVFVKREIKK